MQSGWQGDFFSSPGRKHTVVLSVQLVSNDLVVSAHSSLNSLGHKVLTDFPFKRLEVILEHTTCKRWRTKEKKQQPWENLQSAKIGFVGGPSPGKRPQKGDTHLRWQLQFAELHGVYPSTATETFSSIFFHRCSEKCHTAFSKRPTNVTLYCIALYATLWTEHFSRISFCRSWPNEHDTILV